MYTYTKVTSDKQTKSRSFKAGTANKVAHKRHEIIERLEKLSNENLMINPASQTCEAEVQGFESRKIVQGQNSSFEMFTLSRTRRSCSFRKVMSTFLKAAIQLVTMVGEAPIGSSSRRVAKQLITVGGACPDHTLWW